MTQDIIVKGLRGKSLECWKMRRLLADMIACGDVEVVRHSDNLKRQGLMNKLMRDVDMQGDENAEVNH